MFLRGEVAGERHSDREIARYRSERQIWRFSAPDADLLRHVLGIPVVAMLNDEPVTNTPNRCAAHVVTAP
jgi:hypothetical protein